MYRKISDFLADWDYESASTIKHFESIPETEVHKKFHPQVRSMGRLAWHITETVSEMMNRTGLHVHGPGEDDLMPWTMAKVTEAYKKSAASLTDELKNAWTDETLNEEVSMYGETWTKGQTLRVLVMHQAHHRGQLSVVMRMAGIKVTGVYGPAEEEWSAMGMKPME